jgi:hypothetical protein
MGGHRVFCRRISIHLRIMILSSCQKILGANTHSTGSVQRSMTGGRMYRGVRVLRLRLSYAEASESKLYCAEASESELRLRLRLRIRVGEME